MKKILAISVLVLAVAQVVYSAGVTLGWNLATDPSVQNYNIYMGTSSRAYTNSQAVCPVFIQFGCTNVFSISNLVPGVTYYFAATSVDSIGLESAFSAEVIYTVPQTNQPPGKPGPPVLHPPKRTK